MAQVGPFPAPRVEHDLCIVTIFLLFQCLDHGVGRRVHHFVEVAIGEKPRSGRERLGGVSRRRRVDLFRFSPGASEVDVALPGDVEAVSVRTSQ